MGAPLSLSGLAVVIPALNEAATIAQVVAGARAHAGAQGAVVVVDDGSSDATGDLAAGAGALVVRNAAPSGYDRALEAGLMAALAAGHTYAITLDADGQLPPDRIPDFHAALTGGADLVVGQRQSKPRLSEHTFALWSRLFLGLPDPFCGMKAYRLSWLAKLGHFDSYGSIGTELAIFIAKSGGAVVSLPLTVAPRESGPSRMGGALRAEARLLRAAWRGALYKPKAMR